MDSCFLISAICAKLLSRATITSFVLLFMCPDCLVRGADITANLDAITKNREIGIEMANKPLTEIQRKYKLALQQYKKDAQNAGDLEGVIAANKALELQEAGTPLSPLSDDPKIAKIQQTCQKVLEDMQMQVDARLFAVDREYANQLEDLIKKLTQAGSLEDAVKVRKIRDQFIEDYKAARARKNQTSAKPVASRTAQENDDRIFSFGFKHINEKGADKYLVSKLRMKKYTEWQSPPITYWGPSANDKKSNLVYKFDFGSPAKSIHLKVDTSSWDFNNEPGGVGRGATAIEVSLDGRKWIALQNSLEPRKWGEDCVYNDLLPAELLGSRILWLRIRFFTEGSPAGSYTVAQFGRSTAASATNVFSIEAKLQ